VNLMYDYLFYILAYTFFFLILDMLFMINVLYRAFKVALEIHLDGYISLPIRSKLSIMRTVLDVYDELIKEDWFDTLFSMPMHAMLEPDFGSETFSYPFIQMMNDGVIEFDVEEIKTDKNNDN
jgi:hypothetical protein